MRQGVALVTGAGRGIGAAVSVALAGAGHDVGLVARTERQLLDVAGDVERAGGRAHVVVCDVTRPQAVAAACADIEDTLGPIEVLVNNAGTAGPESRLADVDPEAWWQAVETNLRGPMLFCRSLVAHMIERGSGLIVNMNSLAATGALPDQSAYVVSKAALARFTDTLAAELAGTSVHVVDVSPGLVRTAMTSGDQTLAGLPDTAWTPVARVAELIVSLASGMPSTLSGRFLHAAVDHPDALAELVRSAPDARRLRLVLGGSEDPLSPG